MPRICYTPKRFSAASQGVIDQANSIIAEYEAQGFDPTLRQLYYQMVARGFIANKQSEYNRLGCIVNDARLAGQIDWLRIQDLTRELRGVSHWTSPDSIIDACARSYRIDKWEGQDYRPEVWVEKDALRNVVERVATELDVSYFACRGYVSQSEMWVAAQRYLEMIENGQTPIIFHLGDHDPSGIDMTRDIRDRLEIFGVTQIEVNRIALNMDQVTEFNPPPNPAKVTDSRFQSYAAEYGDESWELDALDPPTLSRLIRQNVLEVRDKSLYKEMEQRETTERGLLEACSTRWDEVIDLLD